MKTLSQALNEAMNNNVDVNVCKNIESIINNIVRFNFPEKIENGLLFDHFGSMKKANYKKELAQLAETVAFFNAIPDSKSANKSVKDILGIRDQEMNSLNKVLDKYTSDAMIAETASSIFYNAIYRASLSKINWKSNDYEINVTQTSRGTIQLVFEDFKTSATVSTNKEYLVDLCNKAGLKTRIVDNNPGTVLYIIIEN